MHCLMSGLLSSIKASLPWEIYTLGGDGGRGGDRKQAVNTNMTCLQLIRLLGSWSYWRAVLRSPERGHCFLSPAATDGGHTISSCGKAVVSKAPKTVIKSGNDRFNLISPGYCLITTHYPAISPYSSLPTARPLPFMFTSSRWCLESISSF